VLDAAVLGDARRHLADRPEAEHEQAAAGADDVGVLDRLPRGRQHVGEEHEAVVGRAFGDLDRPVVGLRHAQVLRLAAGDLAVELGVAEERRAGAVLVVLRRLALRLQALVAHEAVPAGDVERDDHAVARGDVRDLRPDGLDDTHRLVAEDVAGVDERAQHLVEVQVRAAQAGGRDADDRVGGLFDRRIGNRVDAHVVGPVPGECLHDEALPGVTPAQT
jgi:hypothetical protein